jgi:hypothetical protein
VAGQRLLVAHQGVVAHVEPEHLLLEGQPLRLVELGVGDGDLGRAPARVGLLSVLEGGEQGGDAEVVLARRSSVRSTMPSMTRHSPWRGGRGVEGAPLDQRLHGALVEDHRVDPLAEVEDVGERPVGVALGHDALDQALAHVAHRGQPKTMAAVPVARQVGGELGHRAVDVGHQHLDPRARHSAR